VAETLGRLVGQAEAQWEGLKPQREQVSNALRDVRDRAASMLSSFRAESSATTARERSPRAAAKSTRSATDARARSGGTASSRSAGARRRSPRKRQA
jgi:hypothetical protein